MMVCKKCICFQIWLLWVSMLVFMNSNNSPMLYPCFPWHPNMPLHPRFITGPQAHERFRLKLVDLPQVGCSISDLNPARLNRWILPFEQANRNSYSQEFKINNRRPTPDASCCKGSSFNIMYSEDCTTGESKDLESHQIAKSQAAILPWNRD